MLIDGFDTDKEPFVIAELSANHNGSLKVAIDTIKEAKKCGADAIKLQTYRADTITIDCDNDYFKIKQGTIWDGRKLFDLYKEAYTPWEWHKELFKVAREEGLICFSSPFDKSAVDFLEELDTPAYKIASFEVVDTPLIEYVAKLNKPTIISTGIATLSDIELSVNSVKKYHNNLALLKCTSSYPAKIEDANLKTIPNLKDIFGVEVGLSDHTLGITAPVVAVSLGARIIEKHFILDKNIGGADSSFSLEPSEFKAMVKAVKEANLALGEVNYNLSDKIKKSREFSRSLFICEDIKQGEIFNEINTRSIRPAFGLHPKYLPTVLGKRAKTDIKKGTPLSWELIEK